MFRPSEIIIVSHWISYFLKCFPRDMDVFLIRITSGNSPPNSNVTTLQRLYIIVTIINIKTLPHSSSKGKLGRRLGFSYFFGGLLVFTGILMMMLL